MMNVRRPLPPRATTGGNGAGALTGANAGGGNGAAANHVLDGPAPGVPRFMPPQKQGHAMAAAALFFQDLFARPFRQIGRYRNEVEIRYQVIFDQIVLLVGALGALANHPLDSAGPLRAQPLVSIAGHYNIRVVAFAADLEQFRFARTIR